MMAGRVLLCCCAAAAAASATKREEMWFESAIDHFDMTSTATYKQRCLVDSSALAGSARAAPHGLPPLFFYTGNEGAIEEFAESAGLLDVLAPRFGALVVFCEHRYYGKSLPFGPGRSGSFSRAHIGKLSVEQALADYALLIPRIKARCGLPASSPTIAFGGSYGGMLAAYMRLRYPALVDGAIAASAPLRFPVGARAQPGFYEAVSDDLAAADARCPDAVRRAFSQLLQLAAPHDSSAEAEASRASLARRLRLCGGTLERRQIGHLLAWARNAFVVLSMCDYPYPSSFLAPLPAWPIEAACRLMASHAPELAGLGAVASLVYNASAAQLQPTSLGAHVRASSGSRWARAQRALRRAGGERAGGVQSCFDLDAEYVVCADQTGCGLGDTALAWDFQSCSEVSLLVSTDNVTDPFPPHAWGGAQLAAYCKDAWGVTPRTDWAQASFGGSAQDPARGFRSGGSNIVFSNGLLDPWHGGGFLRDVGPSMPAVLLPKGAHHLDLRKPDPRDPPGTAEAREREAAEIGRWLREAAGARGRAAA